MDISRTNTSFISKVNRTYWLWFSFLVVVLFILCFNNLGNYNVQDWDEGTHGVNAYEMFTSGNYLVNTYCYIVDYYNLKPPLSMDIEAFAFTLFGTSIFSLRFFSALFTFLLGVATLTYLKFRFGSLESIFGLLGFLSFAPPFINHCFRSGDADALFVIFFTLAMILLLESKNKRILFVFVGLCFSICFLLKSFHAFVIPLIVLIYLLLTKEITKYSFYHYLFIFILAFTPILIWGICRYQYDGWEFIGNMFTDFFDRSTSGYEGHDFPIYYYLGTIFVGGTGSVVALIAIAIIIYITYSFIRNRNFISFIKTNIFTSNYSYSLGVILWIVIPFILYSFIPTKLDWYIYPSLLPLTIFLPVYVAHHLTSKKDIVKITSIFSLCSLLALVGTISYNVYVTFTYKVTGIQEDIITFAREYKEYEGRDIYLEDENTHVPSPSKFVINNWPQSSVFICEAYGDYICKDGGYDEYILHPGSLLISQEIIDDSYIYSSSYYFYTN